MTKDKICQLCKRKIEYKMDDYYLIQLYEKSTFIKKYYVHVDCWSGMKEIQEHNKKLRLSAMKSFENINKTLNGLSESLEVKA